MFGLVIGSEKIASVRTVNELLTPYPEDYSHPCTPVVFEPELKAMYESQPPATKDLLGHALLLILTFMDICIYKNPVSIKALFNNNSNINNNWKIKS